MHLKVEGMGGDYERMVKPMMKNEKESSIVSILCLLVILPFCQLTYAEQKLSQFGITWTFDRHYTVGQFANGDYWVVGPVTIIGIDPPSISNDGRIINGSMINPSPKLKTVHGYDSGMFGGYARYGKYDPNLNVVRPNQQMLSESNPLVVSPGSSLVSTVSTQQADQETQLQTAAILSVLDDQVAQGSFRPPYVGTDKSIRYNKNQLNYSLLASLKPTPGVPNLRTVERYFERPWLDHIPGWMNGYQHPEENMPYYGREMSTQIGIGALMLHLNFTNRQKETLLVRYVQLGIDLYGIVRDGGENNWHNDGGIASGRKWPILFAGLALDDSDLKSIGAVSGDYLYADGYGPGNIPPDYVHFGEDDQTFYVSDGDIYEPPYKEHSYHGEFTYYGHGSGDKHRDYLEYKEHHHGLPEWGIRHSTNRNIDGLDWDSVYRQVTANSWGGFILAVHIMGVKDLWNHNALFDYKDRYAQVEVEWRETSRFVNSMWDAYRSDYGPVWTMSTRLNITANNGSVTRYPDQTSFVLGESVVLSLVADPGYEFAGWSGDLSGDENPATIVMQAHRSIAATFAVRSNSDTYDSK